MLFVLYLFPALIELLGGSFFFVATVRVAQSGEGPVVVGAVLTVWGVCYMLSSLVSGRLARRTSPMPLVLVSCAVMALTAVGFVLVPAIAAMFAIMAVFGVAVGFFFPPYMVFIRDFATGIERSLHVSAAEYTFAWSLGAAEGPFIAGFLWRTAGWQWVFALDALLALGTGAGTILLARLGHQTTGASHAAVDTEPSAEMPDLARIGWVVGGALHLALSAVRGIFPSAAVVAHVTEADQGIVLATIFLGQAGAALVMSRGRSRMYAAWPLVAAGATGAAGLALFGLARTTPQWVGAAVLLGICSGFCNVYMAFHAMSHPQRAGAYIGINEAIVGLTGILGPLAGGALAAGIGHSPAFLVIAGAYAAAVVVQMVFRARAVSMQPARASATTRTQTPS